MIRHLDNQLFKRLRGRCPELSRYLFCLKARYVEYSTKDDVEFIKEIVEQTKKDGEHIIGKIKEDGVEEIN